MMVYPQDGSTVYIEVEGGRYSWIPPPVSSPSQQAVDLRRSSALDGGEVAEAVEEVEGGEARDLEKMMTRLQARTRGYLIRCLSCITLYGVWPYGKRLCGLA